MKSNHPPLSVHYCKSFRFQIQSIIQISGHHVFLWLPGMTYSIHFLLLAIFYHDVEEEEEEEEEEDDDDDEEQEEKDTRAEKENVIN